jgi:hypothetical protein
MRFIKFTVLLLLALAFVGTVTTPANAEEEGLWTREKLTGDWGGGRTYLSDHGLDFGLRLSQYWQEVSTGGRDTNNEWGGTMDYRLTVDTNKLLGTWKGFSIDMHARTRWGQDVLADAGGFALPNTGLLMPAPGDYHDTDITGLTINQYFPVGEKHLGLATLGLLDIPDALTLFWPSVGYGQEGFMNTNALVSALPWFGAVQGLSLYGGWLATINKEYKIGQSAILVTGTQNASTEMSTDSFSDSFEDGVWIAAFHRFLYKIDDKPGYFMVFGGYSTKDQASNDPHDFVIKPGVIASNKTTEIIGPTIEDTDEKKPWDIALYLSQVFWQAEQDPTRKATILIGGTAGPDDPQFAQYNFFTAVEGHGLMASRPHDRMGVADWYNWLSDNYIDLVSPVADIQDTWGFELYYSLAINQWAHLTPDLQLIENEWKDDDLAVVSGVRLVIDF